MTPSFTEVLHSPLTLVVPSAVALALPPLISLAYTILPASVKLALAAPAAYIAPFCSLDEIYPRPAGRRVVGEAAGWKILLLVLGAAAIALRYFATAGWELLEGSGTRWIWKGVLGFLWVYVAVVPVLRVLETANATLIVFYGLSALYSTLILLSALYQYSLLPPIPHAPVISLGAALVEAYTIVFDLLLLGISLSLPVSHVPAEYTADYKAEIEKGTMGASPEDRTSVYGWITFDWVYPLIKLGSNGYLNDNDVYTLSPTQRSKPLFAAFQKIKNATLLRKLVKTNGLDLALDASLTAVSVILNYSSPYFLKEIIEALTAPSPESIAKAYTYALLAFLATLLKAECDLNHLWFSRRASVRVKSTLTSAIYEKALLRIDKSGVGDSKGSAGVGKVVNLMAGDTNRISNQVSSLYMLYASPFELVVCCVFLYSLLGWSAFAGLAVIVASMPINKGVSSRSVVIQKDLLAARDTRMNIMNELIGAIKYIKAFAWERQWMKRVLDAREIEMKVVIRDRINNLVFTLLWTAVPMAVTVVSFVCFVKLEGGEITAASAFTALSLFSMVRMPLTVLPMYAIALLQCKVAIQRIEAFLQEEEVPTFVSSIKLEADTTAEVDDKIGFTGKASFRWNGSTVDGAKGAQDGSAKDAVNNVSPSPSAAGDAASDEQPEAVRFELSDLEFLFPLGLTIISGPTGAGKTALLHALLGEMECTQGTVHLPKVANRFDANGLSNSVAYSGQTAWLQNLSIKDNILFGAPFDEKRYKDVLRACCLAPDLQMLEDGDNTEIGAKGVSLSGGQKARVALARAIYSRAKNILLDDPLSAVDAHTAASLVNDCLSGPLLAHRRVIIVSHHVELLTTIAHSLIRIVDGRVETQGTIKELQARGDLASIVATEKTAVSEDESVIPETPQDASDLKATDAAAAPKKEARRLVKDEEREIGAVGWATYSLYFRSSGYVIWAATLLLMLLSNNASIVERAWIRIWANAYPSQQHPPKHQFTTSAFTHHHHASTFSAHGHVAPQEAFVASLAYAAFNMTVQVQDYPPADTHPFFYISIWTAILGAAALVTILQTIIGYFGAYRASLTMHSDMLKSVVRSTSRWFDTTPTGRIVNRFSRDIETVDSSLTQSLRVVFNYGFALVGALVVVCAITPAFFIPAMFLAAAYYTLSVRYIRCGRDLRRMESTTRSPIFSGFSETLEGIVTIRAFSKERAFMEKLQRDVDKSHACWYFTWMLNRWLLLRFDCLGGLAVFITSILALASGVDGGLGGMAILSSQTYVSSIYWLCRFWSQLEMDLNSVERVAEYLQLPQEAPAIVESNRPPAYWPSTSGETLIKVEDLTIKYSPELPAVIHGISFDIRPREKIGLIGRTGSGKSTLGMSLLRFAEPAGGKIIIDGIDITKIGLEDLRSRITIIPQEAILFTGTVRDNLDPFNDHTDEEVLSALERVHLGGASATATAAPSRVASSTALAALDDGQASSSSKRSAIKLDTAVTSGGSNFSQGQRQLLAIARSILRASSIIIMDEATASVDFSTDAALQETIRHEFANSCLITIAHRLSSIIDYDRLLVLDHGKLIEFDTPYALLNKPTSETAIFRSMVEKSGKWNELYAAAEQKHLAEQQKE